MELKKHHEKIQKRNDKLGEKIIVTYQERAFSDPICFQMPFSIKRSHRSLKKWLYPGLEQNKAFALNLQHLGQSLEVPLK